MANKVNDTSTAVAAMQSDLEKVDALMGGTKAMRLAGPKYLPKWPMEDQEGYDFRLKTSTLYNAFGRTVDNMSAKPFAEPIKLTDIQPEVEAWFDNIDLAGRNLDVFAQEVFRFGLKDGITHILVDFPVTRDEAGKAKLVTRADEIKAGVRPYMVHIKQSQILGWISTTVNGAEVLAQLRIMECVTEPDGEFGTQNIEQVRVLTPGAWSTYRKVKEDWLLHDKGTTSMTSILLATFYTRRTGFMTATPPLIDLADLNIKHWQSSSDQDSILHTARVPILAITGISDEDKIVIGGKSALLLPLNATAAYVEHTGAAIEAGHTSLQDLENQMRAMGAELLVESEVASTATQNNIEDAEAQCQLAQMAQSFGDTLDAAVDMMAACVGLPEQGEIEVFDDFSSGAVLQAASPFVLALIQLVNNGMLSKEDAFKEMQRQGIVNSDLDWEEVQGRISIEPPSFAVPMTKPAPAAADE